MPLHLTPAARALLAAIALISASCQAPSSKPDSERPQVSRNIGAELSEDPQLDRALDRALAAFLEQAHRGSYAPTHVAPDQLARHAFFFDGLTTTRRSRNPDVRVHPATVLKSFSFNDRDYYITLAFGGEHAGEPFLRKVVQVKAVPHAGSYRFECLFDERTAELQTTAVDNVTFRHAAAMDSSEASRFVAFRRTFCQRTNVPCTPLTYYNFESLEDLLHAYGIEFDCNKCNFLSNDLGFGDDEGRRFVTGMARACNIRDYIYAHFEFRCPDPESMFDAVKEGIAVCYGNTWGGVTLAQMNEKFRRKLREQPETNFLVEFRKGRKASLDSHFTHYYLCALLCNELIADDRLDQALELLYSGKQGAQFFARLDRALGISETNFHESVVQLMQDHR